MTSNRPAQSVAANGVDFINSVKALTDKDNMNKIVTVQKHLRRVLAIKKIEKMAEAEVERI